MSYDIFEKSSEDGIQASLILIEYGDLVETPNAYFAYTDFDRAIYYRGKTYWPTVIGREGIESSGSLDRATLEVDISPTTGVVSLYRDGVPTHPVRMTIWQGHVDDDEKDYKVVWTGKIVSIERRARFARINAEPVSASLRRTGLRRNYQYGCPWVLYGPNCKADKTAHSVMAIPINHGKNFVDFNSGWGGAFEPGSFAHGYVTYVEETTGIRQTRTVLKPDNEGTRLILGGSTNGGITDGVTEITIYQGCAHTMKVCHQKFDNLQNYGGMPWIPKKNPTKQQSQFY